MIRRSVADMLGRSLQVPADPRRIVSLCPSQTETLFDLGLADRIVGRTRYCIHPRERVGGVAAVGGTKKVDLVQVRQLQPDLILAEKEENPREMVEALSEIAPVYVTDVVDIASAHRMIEVLGDLTNTSPHAQAMSHRIRQEWQSMPRLASPMRVAYLIWRKPWMAAGAGTYIDSLLSEVGLVNAFSDGTPALARISGRYPAFQIEDLREAAPELVLLSSEPYPFQEKHISEIERALPAARVLLTDGEPWSWYGSGMQRFPGLIRALIPLLGRSSSFLG